MLKKVAYRAEIWELTVYTGYCDMKHNKYFFKQILFEILVSEDCYIDLPVIIQKVKLNLFSS